MRLHLECIDTHFACAFSPYWGAILSAKMKIQALKIIDISFHPLLLFSLSHLMLFLTEQRNQWSLIFWLMLNWGDCRANIHPLFQQCHFCVLRYYRGCDIA